MLWLSYVTDNPDLCVAILSIRFSFSFQFFQFHVQPPLQIIPRCKSLYPSHKILLSFFFYGLLYALIYLPGWHKVREPTNGVHRQQRISSIAKTPNIPCFVAKLHLSRFTRFLGMIFPSFDSNSNRFVNHQNIFAFNEKYFYRQNKLAIDRTGWLSIEPVGYRWLSLAIVGYH